MSHNSQPDQPVKITYPPLPYRAVAVIEPPKEQYFEGPLPVVTLHAAIEDGELAMLRRQNTALAELSERQRNEINGLRVVIEQQRHSINKLCAPGRPVGPAGVVPQTEEEALDLLEDICPAPRFHYWSARDSLTNYGIDSMTDRLRRFQLMVQPHPNGEPCFMGGELNSWAECFAELRAQLAKGESK